MANTSSAKKASRAALRRRVFNMRRRKAVKEAVKQINKLIRDKNAPAALSALPTLYQALDKAAKRGVVKRGNAARVKSRLTKRVAALAK